MASKAIDGLRRDFKQARHDGGSFLDRLGDLQDHATDAAPELARHARDAVDARLHDLRSQFRDQGREAASIAGEQLEAARDFVVEHVQERPLTLTFAALGLGLVFGLVLSSSRR